MLRTIQQILQLRTTPQSSLSSPIGVGVQHKSRVGSVLINLFYNLACVCLFVFQEDIKAVFYSLHFPVVYNFIAEVAIEILTTMLLAYIVSSFIESLIKKAGNLVGQTSQINTSIKNLHLK